MTCRTDECNQGRRKCPTPECCCDEPAIGYEAARLIQDEGGITYAGDEPRSYCEPISGQAIALITALVLAWLVVVALTFSDWFVQLVPRMVAALSI